MNIRQVEFHSLPDDALRVYLLFSEIEEAGTRTKMTVNEASIRTGVPISRFDDAIQVLITKGLIEQKKGMTFTVTREDGLSFDVQFTKPRKYDDQDLEELINENNQLRRQLDEIKGESCGLADVLPEAPASIFRVAESVVHRGLTNEEVFYLTELIVRYGTKRVTTALHDATKAKQPLRAAYVMLRRGRLGKGKEGTVENPEPVVYRNLDNYDPFAMPEGGENEH